MNLRIGNKWLMSCSYCCLALLITTPGPVWAKDINLSLGLGVEYATGSYGTDQRTDSLTVPVTIRYAPIERFDLELVIPYIYQSNGSTVSSGMYRFRNGANNAPAKNSGTAKPASAGGGQTSGSSRSAESESGLGDLSLKTGFIAVTEGTYTPRVKPLLYAQFPTGDENKGLGAGVFSGGAGLELAKWFGKWNVSAEGVYHFQEKSDRFALKNFVSYEAGVACQITDRFLPSLIVKGASAPSDFSSPIAEVRLKSSFRLTGRASVEGYLGTGLTSQSPDFGAGLAVFYDF